MVDEELHRDLVQVREGGGLGLGGHRGALTLSLAPAHGHSRVRVLLKRWVMEALDYATLSQTEEVAVPSQDDAFLNPLNSCQRDSSAYTLQDPITNNAEAEMASD